MVFDSTNNSIFEREDDLGIDDFRNDFYSIFIMNSIKAKLFRDNKNMSELENDFFGIKDEKSKNDHITIDVCVQSLSPEKKGFKEYGYSPRGERSFECFVPSNVDIEEKMKLVFLDDFGPCGIKKGQIFRIELNDFGFWKGQYGFKSFTITAV